MASNTNGPRWFVRSLQEESTLALLHIFHGNVTETATVATTHPILASVYVKTILQYIGTEAIAFACTELYPIDLISSGV